MLGSKFQFHLNFKANSGEPDQTPHSVSSGLVLHCLSMSHKKTLCLTVLRINKNVVQKLVDVAFIILHGNASSHKTTCSIVK